MKKLLLSATVLSIIITSCTQAPDSDKAKATDEQTVAAATGDTLKFEAGSVVKFIGTKPIGQHNGSFDVKEGFVVVNNNALTGGKLVLDLATMKILDADTTGSYKLIGHLSSPDFFDVAVHPTANFEITSVAPLTVDSTNKDVKLKDANSTVQGNLTLKGVTKNISFPAKIIVNGNTVNAVADFNIDRTQWGLAYGNDKSLGDKFIRPEVNISFNVTAKK